MARYNFLFYVLCVCLFVFVMHDLLYLLYAIVLSCTYRDTQTHGRTNGFSLKPAALKHCYLPAEYRSTCLKQLQELTSKDHLVLVSAIMTRNHPTLERMKKPYSHWFIWCKKTSLSIDTGATSDIASDLLTANGVDGESKHFQDRTESKKKPIHDPIPKQILKTFCDINKPRLAKHTKQITSCLLTWSLLPPVGG